MTVLTGCYVQGLLDHDVAILNLPYVITSPNLNVGYWRAIGSRVTQVGVETTLNSFTEIDGYLGIARLGAGFATIDNV